MLAYRGLGELESSRRHQAYYERFKADEASQILTGEYRKENPHDNNERQAIHDRIVAGRTDNPTVAPSVAWSTMRSPAASLPAGSMLSRSSSRASTRST